MLAIILISILSIHILKIELIYMSKTQGLLKIVIINTFLFFNRYREAKRKIVANVRDVLIQEIMTLSGSEFEGEAIDMDSVAFAGKYFDLFRLKYCL